jgi:TrmH family RNA methyltransferase
MIVSRQNQKIKDIRRVKRCKGDRALLEGPHLIHEAVECDLVLEYVLVTPDFRRTAKGALLVDSLGSVDVFDVEASLLDAIADADSPQGIVAVVSLSRGGVESIPNQNVGLFLYVDGLQDPGNLGALVRSAEAFSVRGVALSRSSVHPNHPRALRASAGSLLRVHLAVDVEPQELARHLESLDPFWAALTPRGGDSLVSLEEIRSVILAVGAEGRGLSEWVESRADLRLTIPIESQVESLNATVAASIALYELSRAFS